MKVGNAYYEKSGVKGKILLLINIVFKTIRGQFSLNNMIEYKFLIKKSTPF